MTKDEALKLGLEALEADPLEMVADVDGHMVFLKDKAIIAIKEALAQPEQEPVAWQVMVEDEAMKEFSIKDMAHDWCVQQKLSASPYAYWIRPLYTAPPQRKPLTDERLETMAEKYVTNCYFDTLQFARAIEAAHGIKE